MKYKEKYIQEKDAKEYAQQSFENIRKQNVELLEQIERLQEQLKRAKKAFHEIMDGVGSGKYDDYAIVCCANDAVIEIEKWGIK